MAKYARGFLDFVNASPSPFHAVEECSKRLLAGGFVKIRETDPWHLKQSGKYFFTRNRSTIFAFVVGGKYVPGNGFNIIGAHTDSPCLKLKPKSATSSASLLQVGVQLYGGGLWYTWFDRDLSLAGRVIVRKGKALEHRLVDVNKPLMNIPSLAIHLDRTQNEAFKPNLEHHLKPVLASALKAQLGREHDNDDHHEPLLAELAAQLSCSPADIADFELCLYDHQKATLGGVKQEFIYSARLDNLMSSYCALTALLESADTSLAEEENVRVAALFDNEEVGSESQQGAASSMTADFLHRIAKAVAPAASGADAAQHAEIAFRKSFLVSADMAHAWHPNHTDKHEANHRPRMHGGPSLKHNANQRYATNAVTSFLMKELARRNNVPVQEFCVRNDSPCGSTIGPILSAACGIRTVDLGIPQFAMHSIRETCGVDDADHAVNLFKAFFAQFTKLDQELVVE